MRPFLLRPRPCPRPRKTVMRPYGLFLFPQLGTFRAAIH